MAHAERKNGPCPAGAMCAIAYVKDPSSLTLRRTVRLNPPVAMRPFLVSTFFVVCLAFTAEAAPPKHKAPAPAPAPTAKKGTPGVKLSPDDQPPPDSATPTRGPTRIDFDDRLIQGQTNKSGAVYLYDRKELKIKSMVKKRENFRDEIVGSLYDN
jgi:hypothetical protein